MQSVCRPRKRSWCFYGDQPIPPYWPTPWRSCIEFDRTLLQLNMLARYAAAASKNLDSHDSLVFGFVDGTEIQICRPGEDMGFFAGAVPTAPMLGLIVCGQSQPRLSASLLAASGVVLGGACGLCRRHCNSAAPAEQDPVLDNVFKQQEERVHFAGCMLHRAGRHLRVKQLSRGPSLTPRTCLR
jgi:hypothetical protein